MNRLQKIELYHPNCIVVVILLLGCFGIFTIKERHEHRKLRAAYESALGAFVCAKLPMSNAAELESLKSAIVASRPTVTMVKDQVAYRNDGSSYTISGVNPITDFGIYRRPDGTWRAGDPDSSTEKK